MKCEQCKFWRPEGHMGSCKRYPKPMVKGNHDWCGEFKEIEMLKLPVVTMPEMELPEFPKLKRGRPPKEAKNGE